MLGYRNAASMPSRSRSLIRSCGSKPPGRPSLYTIVSARPDPPRATTAPSRPSPFGLPRIFPSTSKRSLPLSPMIRRGARSRYAGSMYRSQRSRGSRMWPSASMTLYVRAMARLRRDGWFLLLRGGSPCQAPRGGRPLSPRGGTIPAPAGTRHRSKPACQRDARMGRTARRPGSPPGGLKALRQKQPWEHRVQRTQVLLPGAKGLHGPLSPRVETLGPSDRYVINAMDVLTEVGDRLRTRKRPGCGRAFIAVKRQEHCIDCAKADSVRGFDRKLHVVPRRPAAFGADVRGWRHPPRTKTKPAHLSVRLRT